MRIKYASPICCMRPLVIVLDIQQLASLQKCIYPHIFCRGIIDCNHSHDVFKAFDHAFLFQLGQLPSTRQSQPNQTNQNISLCMLNWHFICIMNPYQQIDWKHINNINISVLLIISIFCYSQKITIKEYHVSTRTI